MQHFHGVVKRVRDAIAVTALDAALDTLRIHLDAQKRRAIHCGGEWLRAPHAAHATGDDQPARQRSTKMLARRGSESFVCALQDTLRTNVNPASGGHLAIHDQAEMFELAKLVPVGPVPHK